MSVLVGWAALIETVNALVAPTFMVSVAGTIELTATGCGTTFTTAEAEEPLSEAVIPAWPKASVPIGTATVVCPEGTTTCAGTPMSPAGDTASGTVVSVDCAAEIVSVRDVLAPSVTVATTGTSETTVGGAG